MSVLAVGGTCRRDAKDRSLAVIRAGSTHSFSRIWRPYFALRIGGGRGPRAEIEIEQALSPNASVSVPGWTAGRARG